MKKLIFWGMSCLVLSLITACTTVAVSTEPRFYSNYPNTEVEILGEVVYESKDRIGYIELLKAAREIYPDCDYVIDIMVDEKKTETTIVFFWMRSVSEVSTYVMRGTAIAYARK